MYSPNTKFDDRAEPEVLLGLDVLMRARKVYRPVLLRAKRREKLKADMYVVDYNNQASRRMVSERIPNQRRSITGSIADVSWIIKQNLPDSTFRSSRFSTRIKLNGKPAKSTRKDTWFLAPIADDPARLNSILTLIENKPVTYELMPVCGHFFWRRNAWFIVRTDNMAHNVAALSNDLNAELPDDRYKTFLAINQDNYEIRRMMFNFLHIRRYTKETLANGLKDPYEQAGSYLSNGTYFEKAEGLQLYTREYKLRYGIDADESAANTIWPMWLAREMPGQTHTKVLSGQVVASSSYRSSLPFGVA